MPGRAFPAGKLPADVLERLLGDLPAPGPEVRLGPAIGEDACAIDIGTGTLVAATDPITLTTSDIGGYAVVVNANDVAVLGVRPRWFLATVLLPVGTTEDAVAEIFATMRAAAARAEVGVVGGHTEITPAVVQPVIVGVMLGVAQSGRILRTADARAGDIVVQVGGVPIEGAAVLADTAGVADDAVPADVVASARRAVDDPGLSVVDAALLATDLGATALHDPTEGGLAGALHELAHAAGVDVRLDGDAVLWFAPGVEVCRVLGADPWATLASGALLATFAPDAVAGALHALQAAGHRAAAIGRLDVCAAQHSPTVTLHDGALLPNPARDEVARLLG